MQEIKKRLDAEVEKRNSFAEISLENPDPMLIARKYKDEYIALICALFAYGNVFQIIKFLQSMDFSLLDENEVQIKKVFKSHYYRFQNSDDVIAFFITLRRMKQESDLESIFLQGYSQEASVLSGMSSLIAKMKEVHPYESRGYKFLVGSEIDKKTTSPYKRWNMFLRWMVRKDNIDLGLWTHVYKKDLLMPLDTHTFKVSRDLRLLKRKSYDLKSVIELTNILKTFDPNDPVKYDFALYRIGQSKNSV